MSRFAFRKSREMAVLSIGFFSFSFTPFLVPLMAMNFFQLVAGSAADAGHGPRVKIIDDVHLPF